MKIFTACLGTETNTFAPLPTDTAAYEAITGHLHTPRWNALLPKPRADVSARIQGRRPALLADCRTADAKPQNHLNFLAPNGSSKPVRLFEESKTGGAGPPAR